jgi:hypothetical protein
MAKTNYDFETGRYESYEEKIAELESIFGSWPPPFDPVWAVQVSQGRCGSNGLWSIVDSFFEGAIGDPTFEEMDDINRTPDISQRNWVPENGQKYLYYNIHGCGPNRIHFPVFFWFLTNSPKIVHLTRGDHLTRAISMFYGNISHKIFLETGDNKNWNQPDKSAKLYRHPIDLDKMDNYIKISFIEIEIIKSIVSEFVSEDRGLRVTHQEIFHTNVLNTLRGVAQFLECDTVNSSATIRLHKETRYHLIPNIDEVMEHYQRDLSEQDFWLPEGFDIDSAQNKIEENVRDLIRLNIKVKPRPSFNVGTQKSNVFDIKANQEFYLDEIPVSARYLSHPEFSKLPNLEREIYMLDDRWKTLDFAPDKSYSHFQSLTEVTDIQSNREQDSYEWVCGFSVFFLKESNDPGEERRTLPENHNKLIKGVHQLTDYPDKCPNTLLRFYVSQEVWERLARDGILYRPGTEFCKMASDSETSPLGTIWRSLCLSDTEFEWAIQADCGADEDWILARIAHWDREKFKSWLSPNFPWGSEFLFWEHNWYTEQHPDNFNDCHHYWNLANFDFLSAGSIVTRPEKMPDIEKCIWKYFQSGYSPQTFYHASADAWSVTHQKSAFLPYGWEGFAFDQEIWRFLKKMMPVRHIIHSQSTDHIKQFNIPENHIMKRIVSQLISEGSEFVDIETQAPIFNLQGG